MRGKRGSVVIHCKYFSEQACVQAAAQNVAVFTSRAFVERAIKKSEQ